MTDDESPSFNGFDGMEPEAYVDAVRTRAIKENKLGDDDWMVKYASKGFKGGALRWWAKLDKTNRRNWDWLETALLDRWPPVFKGIDGAECEKFIADAEQRILDAGKEDDNKWIAKEIPKSFAGAALRWLATVDPQTKADWNLLKQAMLSRWPASDQSDPAPSSSVPDAPTPAPPPATAEPATSSPPATVALQGRIRVEAEDGRQLGYISRFLEDPANGRHRGCGRTTNKVAEILLVKFEGTTSPYELRAENPASGYSLLGIHWNTLAPSLVSTSSHRAPFVGLSRGWKSSLVSSESVGGDPFTKVWDVDSQRRITIPWADANGAHWSLQPIRHTRDLDIYACAPQTSSYRPPDWDKVNLHLELSE